MDQEASEFMFCGYLTPQQAELNRQRVDELLAYLRPQAVPLVDAFKLPDYLLSSALGRSDGEVYRALFDFALADRKSGFIGSGEIVC
jgi:acyl-CoA oxidase